MRWPWQKPERRFTSVITEALEAAVASTTGASSSAALESAGGYLARELAAARVQGPVWVQRAVTREWRALVARDSVRYGESVSAIRLDDAGRATLVPLALPDWHGAGIDERDWFVQGTIWSPSSSLTRWFPRAEVVVSRWALSAVERYRGRSPSALAGDTAKLARNAEARLSEEAAKHVAQLLVLPEGVDPTSDESNALRSALKGGMLRFVETVMGGRGDRANAPQTDWTPRHIGPAMKAELVTAARDGYHRMLDAIGLPAALCDAGADGTAQREALRRARLNFVQPFADCLADELSRQLGESVSFRFDNYALDMVSRAQVVSKLTAAGVNLGVAMAAVGLDDG